MADNDNYFKQIPFLKTERLWTSVSLFKLLVMLMIHWIFQVDITRNVFHSIEKKEKSTASGNKGGTREMVISAIGNIK